LQDRHGLSVNMLLWCLWCGEHFDAPNELIVRKADDISRRWSVAVTIPLRNARRALNAPPVQVSPDDANSLKAQISNNELAAEKIEQAALERLATDTIAVAGDSGGAAARSRKALATYIRLTDAVKTPGFSVSLIEDLIGLRFPPSDSDSYCVGQTA